MTKMKFGMPTLVECRDIYECRDAAKKYGLDFIEINMSFPQYQPHTLSADALVEITENDGVFYTIHADEMLNPFDFNPQVSECYFGVMRDTIRFAKAIGAPVINMHLLKGVYVTLPGEVILLSDVYFDEYRELYVPIKRLKWVSYIDETHKWVSIDETHIDKNIEKVKDERKDNIQKQER